jgi:hypothetical protein
MIGMDFELAIIDQRLQERRVHCLGIPSSARKSIFVSASAIWRHSCRVRKITRRKAQALRLRSVADHEHAERA